MNYRLGDICTITKGGIGIMKAVPGPYPMVTLAEERRSHTEYQFDAPGGAVIVPLVSSTGHGHASMKRVHYEEGKFALGNILCALIPKNEKLLLAKYLHIYLQDNKDEVLVPLMRGMANVSLSMGKIAEVELSVPTLEQQRRIIEIEASISQNGDRLAELFNKQDEFTNHLHQAILQDAVQGKLTESWRKQHGPATETAADLLARIRTEKAELVKAKKIKKEKPLPPISEEEVPFALPEGWVWCRLGEVCILITSGSRDWAKYYSNSGAKFVRMGNLSRDSYEMRLDKIAYVNAPDGEGTRTKLEANDILISITGEVGLLGLVPQNFGEAYIRYVAPVKMN